MTSKISSLFCGISYGVALYAGVSYSAGVSGYVVAGISALGAFSLALGDIYRDEVPNISVYPDRYPKVDAAAGHPSDP